MSEKHSRIPFYLKCALFWTAFCLLDCGADRRAKVPDRQIDRFWEPLLETCIKTDTSVTCEVEPFRQAINEAHKCWETSGNLEIDLRKCLDLAAVDKRELEAKVFGLQVELDKWYRVPLIWAGIGILAGLSLGVGLMGL